MGATELELEAHEEYIRKEQWMARLKERFRRTIPTVNFWVVGSADLNSAKVRHGRGMDRSKDGGWSAEGSQLAVRLY